MILKGLEEDRNQEEQRRSMEKHRKIFEGYKKIIETLKPGEQQKLDQMIEMRALVEEKQSIIKDLDKIDGGLDEEFEYFEELAFYQERYLQMIKYLKKLSNPRASINDIDFVDIKKNFCKDARVSMGVYELDEIMSKNKKQNTKTLNYLQKPISDFQSSGSSANMKNQEAIIKKTNPLGFQMPQGNGITKPLADFFQRKEREKKTANFKDIMKDVPSRSKSPLSSMNRSFKKSTTRRPTQAIQIQKLLDENKRLYRLLEKKQKEENELNEFEKNVLREERERCMKKIEELQEEVEELEKNNYRLKLMESEKTKNVVQHTSSMSWNDSYQDKGKMYEPYALPVRHNDLGKISTKNNRILDSQSDRQFIDMDLGIPPIEKKEELQPKSNSRKNLFSQDYQNDSGDLLLQDFFNNQNNNQSMNKKKRSLNYSHGRSMDRGSNFDSFSMANTAYGNSTMFLNASKNLVAIDAETSTRNKVAFFKKSLVIMRDFQYQIAFKKSDLDETKTKLRLIFYIHNKTTSRQKVNIDYDYELTHYQIQVTEPLAELAPQSQGREVIEISLLRDCPDLNSVIDAHFKLGTNVYDLWAPACFIEFKNFLNTPSKIRQTQHMIIQPDRQFRSFDFVSKLMPLSRESMQNMDESQGYATGVCIFGQFDIALNWWQKQLTIETSPKILDFLGFVMHHFK